MTLTLFLRILLQPVFSDLINPRTPDKCADSFLHKDTSTWSSDHYSCGRVLWGTTHESSACIYHSWRRAFPFAWGLPRDGVDSLPGGFQEICTLNKMTLVVFSNFNYSYCTSAPPMSRTGCRQPRKEVDVMVHRAWAWQCHAASLAIQPDPAASWHLPRPI